MTLEKSKNWTRDEIYQKYKSKENNSAPEASWMGQLTCLGIYTLVLFSLGNL